MLTTVFQKSKKPRRFLPLLCSNPETKMAEAINNCPFCGLSFKSVGHHIYRCKLREGREYRQYLKTGRKTGSDYLSLADQSGCAERSQQIQHCELAKPARPLTSSTPS